MTEEGVLLDSNDDEIFFSLRSFFSLRPTHCYFYWPRCWRSQQADKDFCEAFERSSLSSRKKRVNNFLDYLNE